MVCSPSGTKETSTEVDCGGVASRSCSQPHVNAIRRGGSTSTNSPSIAPPRLRRARSCSSGPPPKASTTDLWGSVLKCTLFGAIIAIVCCYKGMTASGGAEGVGRAVNQAVVIAFLGVFAFNYVFTQTLLATHPEITVIR